MRLPLLLLAVLIGHAYCTFIIKDNDMRVMKILHRLKRYSEDGIHGHSIAVLHGEDLDTGHVHRLTKRDVLNHASQPSLQSRKFTLELQTQDDVHLNLFRKSVITPSTKMVERRGDEDEVLHDVPSDCFFTGPVQGSRGHAAVSLCDGQPMGSVIDEKRHYEIHDLSPEVTQKDGGDDDFLHVLVTWTNVNESSHSGPHDDLGDVYDNDDYDDEMGGLNEENDDLEIPSTARQRRSALTDLHMAEHVVSRDPSSKTAVIETAAYMDYDFQTVMKNRYHFTNVSQLFKVALLKFCGMSSVYSDPKLGWNITIRLVHVEVWTENPGWYLMNGSAPVYMSLRMGKICYGTRHLPFDQVTLWTARSLTQGRIGLAWVGGACMRRYRCNVQTTPTLRYVVELHEFGHSLGMGHEWTIAACNTTVTGDHRGFMAGLMSYAPKCYGRVLDNVLPRKKCFFRDVISTTSDAKISQRGPGQVLGFDGQCKFKYGDEYVYLHSPSPKVCRWFDCIANDPNQTSYGTIQTSEALDGTPCGDNLVCINKVCQPLNRTSYVGVFAHNLIVGGGWGPWADLFSCPLHHPINHDPELAAIRVTKRPCDSPEPKNGPYCPGEAYKAELCHSTDSRHGPVDIGPVAKRICTFHRDHDPPGQESATYTTSGFLRDSSAIGSCSIRCRRKDRRRGSVKSYGLPDGTPCSKPGSALDDDFNGVGRYCVGTTCMAFGCDGKTLGEGGGKKRDVCGECGGMGNGSCVYGQFTGPFSSGTRHTLVVLPAGASNIYIGHPLDRQKYVSIELWTKDADNKQVVLSQNKRVGYSEADKHSPFSFADTFWYYDKLLQSLTATGPVNQPVNVTLYKTVNKEFHRAIYRYTKPSGGYLQPPVCTNGGTLFHGGCACPKDFYGLRCEHRCRILCRNGAALNPTQCKCRCNSRQTGRDCVCKFPFKGENCLACALSGCQNGGVFSRPQCKCDCPINCEGLDCSKQCGDTRSKGCPFPGRCQSSSLYASRCRKTCSKCAYDATVNNGQCHRPSNHSTAAP